jgi:hypothetical protein
VAAIWHPSDAGDTRQRLDAKGIAGGRCKTGPIDPMDRALRARSRPNRSQVQRWPVVENVGKELQHGR